MRTLLFASVIVLSSVLLGGCASEGGGDITGKDWHLISITTNSPKFDAIVPAQSQANYTIKFASDGTFEAKADCNEVAGTYTIQGKAVLTIKPGPSTLAACPADSYSDKYVAALAQASSYSTAANQMTITLLDNGTLTFQTS